jgi:hypothetical protein
MGQIPGMPPPEAGMAPPQPQSEQLAQSANANMSAPQPGAMGE